MCVKLALGHCIIDTSDTRQKACDYSGERKLKYDIYSRGYK